MLKTQVTDGELDGAVGISENIHSRFNLNVQTANGEESVLAGRNVRPCLLQNRAWG